MRGVFVSLSAVLIIGIILISVIASQERKEEQTLIELDYLQNRLATEYLDVIDKATIPREVARHAKGVIATSPPADHGALGNLIRSDVTDEVNAEYERLSLPFENLELTSFTITGWSQPDEWTIRLTYTYALRAESSPGIEWTINDGSGSVDLSVVGLEHGAFDVNDHGSITREFWGVNKSLPFNNECVLGSFSGYGCGPIRQICPYAFSECRP